MTDCADIQKTVRNFSLVEDCDTIRDGILRLATPFVYPDGSQIDVFLATKDHLWEKFDLTDMGQTTANLLDLNIKTWATKKRKQIISDICKSLRIEHNAGVFRVPLSTLAELPDGIVRLTQACIRASDLAFTQRLAVPIALREDVEEFLASAEWPYESDVPIVGPYGKPVVIDFSVSGPRSKSLIQTLGTANSVSAHTAANEVLRKWVDLYKVEKGSQFISIYDSRNDAVRNEDVARLGDFSAVYAFPEQQEEIRAAIAA